LRKNKKRGVEGKIGARLSLVLKFWGSGRSGIEFE